MASHSSTSAVGTWLGPERRPLTALLGTGFLSLISNQLTALAVPWFVLVLTGSATKMGITAIATMLPSVVMMFVGGAIADRTSPRKLSAFSDVLSGVTVAFVPLLYALGYLSFSLLLVLMVAGALFDTPGYSGRSKLLPQLSARGDIAIERVTSLQGVFHAISGLFGAILAGVLISSLGAANVLWINAAAFAVSAIVMLKVIPEMHVPRENVPSVVEDIQVGLRYVRHHSLIRPLLLAALVINALLVPITAILLPYLAKTEWNSATSFGLLVSGAGAGALVGSLAVGVLTERLSPSTIMRISLALLSLPIFFAGAASPAPFGVDRCFLNRHRRRADQSRDFRPHFSSGRPGNPWASYWCVRCRCHDRITTWSSVGNTNFGPLRPLRIIPSHRRVYDALQWVAHVLTAHVRTGCRRCRTLYRPCRAREHR